MYCLVLNGVNELNNKKAFADDIYHDYLSMIKPMQS